MLKRLNWESMGINIDGEMISKVIRLQNIVVLLLIANFASVRLLSGMGSHVSRQQPGRREALVADGTYVRFLPGVRSCMNDERLVPAE